MARFSERMGFKPIRDVVQKDSMDDALRTSLWNALVKNYWSELSDGLGVQGMNNAASERTNAMWRDYFRWRLDKLPPSWSTVKERVREYYEQCAWYEVYDFVEFIVNSVPFQGRDNLISECNEFLEREMSAYRFVGTRIAPITSEQEIAAIEQAIAAAEASKRLNSMSTHLKQALAL